MTMVRIITGTAKGIELAVPHKARPIGDRAKSSLFSVLGPDIKEKNILDLYAGSGALGLEALSRGASHCTFVESSRYASDDIKRNLEKTNLADRAEVTKHKALSYLAEQEENSFDIVFADPPFNFYKESAKRVEGLLRNIDRVIPDGGAIILKHPSRLELPDIEGLVLADHRIFGSNAVTIWVKVPHT